jgi:hypothetical protein|tara:strand:+ start:400 stop:564 length:165 start_codon:yes stop_codon:yes gene_type:complete
MAKTLDKEKVYTLIILGPDGEEVHRKSIPAEIIDETNFTKHHKVKALLNILSKS